jgi:hypothetical protein
VRGPAVALPDHDVLLFQLARDGRLTNPRVLDVLRVRLPAATDCFVFCPGWVEDPVEGRDAAARFFSLLDAALAPARERVRPLRVAVHWPSRPFAVPATPSRDGGGSEEDAPAIVGCLADLARGGSDVLRPLIQGVCELEIPLGPEEELELDSLVRQARVYGSRGAGTLTPLHALSFWLTKRRAGQVGDRLGREWLAPLHTEAGPKAPRIHLIGHSFGARVLASSVLGGVQAQSLVLLLAAFSAFAFAEEVPHMERPGTYRRVVAERLVSGPIVAVRSDHDRVLGGLYPVATWGDPVEPAAAMGGRHGRTRELVARSALGATGALGVGAPELDLLDALKTGLPRCVVTVDGSTVVARREPLIGAHCDVLHEEIATLVLLAAGVLRAGPAGIRPPRITPWDVP